MHRREHASLNTAGRRILTGALVLAAALAAVPPRGASAAVSVGAEAPAFTLQDLDGASHSLADYRGKVVVLEWINPNCPFSRRHATEKTMVQTEARHPGVVWLGVNSTSPSHRDYEAPAAHKKYDAEKGIDYTVLLDPTGATGHAYGAQATPHMFVIDERGTVIYDGAIDDDPSGRKAMAARVNYVDLALAAHAAGKPVAPASTDPYGCSIKYR